MVSSALLCSCMSSSAPLWIQQELLLQLSKSLNFARQPELTLCYPFRERPVKDIGKRRAKQQNKDLKNYCDRCGHFLYSPESLDGHSTTPRASREFFSQPRPFGCGFPPTKSPSPRPSCNASFILSSLSIVCHIRCRVVEAHEDELTAIIRSDDFNITRLPETLCAKLQGDCKGVRTPATAW